MRALKTGERHFTSKPSQHPSSSRRKRSSRTSSELKSLEECLASEKMEKKREESGRKGEKEAAAKLPPAHCIADVQEVKLI